MKWYIVGLVDGEGCFYVLVRNSGNNSKNYVRAQTHFHLEMKEDDHELLCSLQDYFGCGTVQSQPDTRPNHVNCYRYTVSSNKDIHDIIIPFFLQNPLKSSKYKDFLVFKVISDMIHKGLHLNDTGLEEIRELKMQMNTGTRRVREIRSHGGNTKKP